MNVQRVAAGRVQNFAFPCYVHIYGPACSKRYSKSPSFLDFYHPAVPTVKRYEIIDSNQTIKQKPKPLKQI